MQDVKHNKKRGGSYVLKRRQRVKKRERPNLAY